MKLRNSNDKYHILDVSFKEMELLRALLHTHACDSSIDWSYRQTTNDMWLVLSNPSPSQAYDDSIDAINGRLDALQKHIIEIESQAEKDRLFCNAHHPRIFDLESKLNLLKQAFIKFSGI